MHKKLRTYQLEVIEIILEGLRKNRGFLLADETGLGKTVQALKVLHKVVKKNALIADSRNLAIVGVFLITVFGD